MHLNHLVDHLGEQGFPTFTVARLRHARVVMDNGYSAHRSDDEILNDYGRIIASEEERGDVSPADTRLMWAERYGGLGNGTHLGGVRCGYDGTFQVKGLGSNGLMGKGMPEGYTHGGMALFECIQETMWGEIFDIALPHGAIRSLGVLSTGTTCWWTLKSIPRDVLAERYGPDVYLPRGLLLREPAVRPAHFDRALFTGQGPESIRTSVAEVARVRRVIQLLPDALPMPAADNAPEPALRLTVGLLEMVRRFAAQAAAAVSKRLVHGNISLANIALDGKWLDYGSANSQPFWGQIVGYESFWNNGAAYGYIIETLCHNLEKYLDRSEVEYTIPSGVDLYAAYVSTYEHELTRRFVGLTGFPPDLIENGDDIEAQRALYKLLRAIATMGHDAPYSHVDLPDESYRYGHYRLEDCIHGLQRQQWMGDEVSLAAALPDASKRAEFVAAFARVHAGARRRALEHGVTDVALKKYLILQAAKTKRFIPLMFRAQMVRETERIVFEHREPSELRKAAEGLTSELRDACACVYADPQWPEILVWKEGDRQMVYCALTDQFFEKDDAGKRACQMPSEGSSGFVARAWRFWGAEVWRFIDEV